MKYVESVLTATMTVSEMIEELKKCPPDAPVLSEGCDCFGEVRGALLNTDQNNWSVESDVVILRRRTHEESQKEFDDETAARKAKENNGPTNNEPNG